MISCQVCWRITEMAQRSNRRFLNLISEEVPRGRLANKEESGRNPSWPGVLDSTKGRIHWRRPNRHPQIFRLQFCGGPYIPICGAEPDRVKFSKLWASHLESNMVVKRVLTLAEYEEPDAEHRKGDAGQFH